MKLDAFIVKTTSPYSSVLGNLLGIDLQNNTKHSSYDVHLELLNKFLTENDLPALVIDNQKTQVPDNEPKLTKPQKREIALLEYLKSDDGFTDILKLPTMAKKQAREYLIKNQPKLFTDSTFDQACASLSSRGDISLADKKKYLSK